MEEQNLQPKGRRGSILVILMFVFVMAIVTVGTLRVASALYASNRESAQNYARIQTYRASTEIACYQYISELESLNATRDLNGDWIGVSGVAIYGEAIDLLVDSISKSAAAPGEDFVQPLTWTTDSIVDAIAGAPVSNPVVVTDMLATLEDGRNSFKLYLGLYPEIDWNAVDTFVSPGVSNLRLQPLEVHVSLKARGEDLNDILFVDGLYLNTFVETSVEADGSHTRVTMSIVEGDNGIEIYRS